VQLVPYLNFDGNCAEAFRFYEGVLGGKIEVLLTHADSPVAAQVPPEWKDRVLHARLVVGDQVLLASDAPPEKYAPTRGIYAFAGLDTPEEAERIFAALAGGGTITMPFGPTFWASAFGMCVDRFGIGWMVNCSLPAEVPAGVA
jgi:PhnB protein